MRKLFVLLFVVCLAMSAHAQFRNVHTLSINGSLSGNISNGSHFYYEVRTTSSGTLIVETNGSTDTYLVAYDSSYREITYNDDGGQGANARIELQVSANQTYYFNLTGYGEWTSGPFNITAAMVGGAVDATELRVGTTHSGYIQYGEVQRFRVRLDSDPWYQISWDDSDRQHFGSLANPADVRVGIRREDSSSYIVPLSDSGNWTSNFSSYSNQHRVHHPNSGSQPRFDPNAWYIIEVEGWYSGGNFRLYVE